MKDHTAFACSSKLCISAVTAMMIDSGTKSAPFIGMATWLTYCNSDEGSPNRLKDDSGTQKVKHDGSNQGQKIPSGGCGAALFHTTCTNIL